MPSSTLRSTAGYGGSFFLIDSFLGPAQGNPLNGRVYAFKLGGRAPKPVLNYRRAPMPEPPRLVVKADAYARGARLYERNCTVCHGVAALSGGVLPDLRRSVRLQDSVAFRRALVEGELAPLGMPRFGKYVSAEDAELIRAYVARQALMAYEAEQRSATASSR